MPAETENAWMAGFIDGEGHLNITKQVRRGRPSPAYRAYVAISNTNRNVLTAFSQEYGGSIYYHYEDRQDKSGLKWSDAFTWQCPVSSTKRLLLDILPHLKLKRRQVELILEFIAKKNAFARRRKKGWGSAPLSEEEIQFRENLSKSVRALNMKGHYARHLGRGVPESTKPVETTPP